MIPQVAKRRIGNIHMIDVNGSLTGLWASRLRQQIESLVQNLDAQSTVLNLRHVTDMDSLGAKSVFEAVASCDHLDLILGDPQVMDLFNRYPESRKFRQLTDEEELVRLYGSQLLETDNSGQEHRRSGRLQTALSIRFSYLQGSRKKHCVGIVSNASAHGFYVEYIDVLSVEESLIELNPYDIQEIEFALSLPNGKNVCGRGNVSHRQLNGDQFGIGIHIESFEGDSQKHFYDFLKPQRKVMFAERKDK